MEITEKERKEKIADAVVKNGAVTIGLGVLALTFCPLAILAVSAIADKITPSPKEVIKKMSN